jgi:hypothetical protein
MTRKLFIFFVAPVVLCVFSVSTVAATPIDLSAFDVIDPTVTLGPNNDSATIEEDPFWAPVGLWEYDLAIPEDALSLTFAYALDVKAGNEDYFDFYFGDLTAPFFSVGGSEGVYAGTITEDIMGYAGGPLPLAFALNYGFGDLGLDSVLTLSGAQINPVPEPSTFLLLGFGLAGAAGLRRKFKR